MQIATAALRQAQDNYNKKFTEEVAKATKDASADLAQYMCQKMAQEEATTLSSPTTDLTPPYAISYDVGTGLKVDDLVMGGAQKTSLGGVSFRNDGYLGNGEVATELGGGTKETRALFNRETRTCNICTTIVTQSCKTKGSKSWFHNNRNVECETGAPIEQCRDIPM